MDYCFSFFFSQLGSIILQTFIQQLNYGSVYYIIRHLGYKIKGYNIIKSIGFITPLIIIISMLYLILNKKNKKIKKTLEDIFLLLCLFFIISMVVHPWYIIIFLGLFTKYNFQVIWSALIFLTYSAYQNSKVEENFYLLGLEYIVVFGFFIYDFFKQEKIKPFSKKKSLL